MRRSIVIVIVQQSLVEHTIDGEFFLQIEIKWARF